MTTDNLPINYAGVWLFFLAILFAVIAIWIFSKWLTLGPKFNQRKEKMKQRMKFKGVKSAGAKIDEDFMEGDKKDVDAHILLNKQKLKEQMDTKAKEDELKKLEKSSKKKVKIKNPKDKAKKGIESKAIESADDGDSIQDLLNESESGS